MLVCEEAERARVDDALSVMSDGDGDPDADSTRSEPKGSTVRFSSASEPDADGDDEGEETCDPEPEEGMTGTTNDVITPALVVVTVDAEAWTETWRVDTFNTVVACTTVLGA